MMKNLVFIGMLALLLMQACSNRQVYDAMQARERNECMKVPESQYQECMERTHQSYDEFKRERDNMEK